MGRNEKRDTAAELPERHKVLLAFLGDLWEQADLAGADFCGDPLSVAILEELQARIAALAVLLTASRDTPRRSGS